MGKHLVLDGQGELPLGDLHIKDTYKFATPEQFVLQYSGALKEYLEKTLTTGESHIEDLAAHAAGFAEAFDCISGWF